ncbi:MAG: acyl-CoA carboxylase subunit beta [Mycobacteriales bacterium]
MPVLVSQVDPSGEEFLANRAHNDGLLKLLDEQLGAARAGGGAKYTARHKQRGRLLARERIDLLVDPGSAFLELSPLAAWGTSYAVGGSIVTGIGVVEGVECVVLANDPTVKGGTSNPYTWKKIHRAMAIARENRLPVVNLVESGGGDLPSQAEFFVGAGKQFRDLTQLSAMGVPSIALVFGNSTAGGAYVPGMCDYTVMIDEQSKVFLGGPPLVKMATGEVSTDEELGGARMHAFTSGLSDYFAKDERDAIRLGRQIVAGWHWTKLGPQPAPVVPPRYDPAELGGIASADLRIPFSPLEVLARILDGSEFDEYKPGYGTSMVTGWGRLHGYPVGVIANANGVIFSDEAKKASEFISLSNQVGTPLLFLHNTTGFIVGRSFEQGGIIKDGAKLINAVANSTVPHLSLMMGASYGAGNYGMCGRAFDPRFLFAWPNSRTAVMGPTQLAGVLSIVAREAAEAGGYAFDEARDAERTAEISAQIEKESFSFFMSGKLYDDGVIDPADTRTVLGIALSACHSNTIEGRRGFGVFRM